MNIKNKYLMMNVNMEKRTTTTCCSFSKYDDDDIWKKLTSLLSTVSMYLSM